MSVAGEFRVDIRPYSGYVAPGLPVATWVSQAGIAGDASGGTVVMDLLFQRDGDAQISELFSLDQLALDTTSSASHGGSMNTLGMDTLAPNRPLSTQLWHFSIVSFNASAALDVESNTILPIWLGTPNRDEGGSGLRFVFTNVDLRLYQVIAQGYMWGPRSVLAEGGPRHPVGGLFRS